MTYLAHSAGLGWGWALLIGIGTAFVAVLCLLVIGVLFERRREHKRTPNNSKDRQEFGDRGVS